MHFTATTGKLKIGMTKKNFTKTVEKFEDISKLGREFAEILKYS